MGATVTWACACDKCACVAPVVSASAWCGNCANGQHHNMINR